MEFFAPEFFDTRHLPPSVNETLIILSPKVDAPEFLSHFRPISLCNIIYKLLTKTIMNRIKPILPKVTAPK